MGAAAAVQAASGEGAAAGERSAAPGEVAGLRTKRGRGAFEVLLGLLVSAALLGLLVAALRTVLNRHGLLPGGQRQH